jgi:hypothetical protein
MNHYCEVNTAPMATGPDDPRYEPCGEPARFQVHDTWMCAEHYDEYMMFDRSSTTLEEL